MYRHQNRRRGAAERRPVQKILSTDGCPVGTYPVIDPYSKRLFIPVEDMIETRAIHREGVPSLCRVFLEGRCRQGANCFQAHANVETVRHLRAKALAEPVCCAFHGAKSSVGDVHPRTCLTIKNEEGETVAAVRLEKTVMTSGLRRLIESQSQGMEVQALTEVTVPTSSLCRLHNGDNGSPCCRFEGECNFVHLCRQVVNDIDHLRGAAKAAMYLAAPEVTTLQHCTAAATTVASTAAAAHPLARTPTPIPAAATSDPLSASDLVQSYSAMCSAPLRLHPASAASPPIQFHLSSFGTTAPNSVPESFYAPMGRSSQQRSFSSTASKLLWRHNPYHSSGASTVIET